MNQFKPKSPLLRAFVVCLLGFVWFKIPHPTPLFDGIKSYQSFAQIKMMPKFKNAKWKVTIDSALGPDDERPPFEIVVAETNYSHLAFPGKVTLKFYNKRLYSSSFRPLPAVAVQYRNALSKATRTKLNPKATTSVRGMTYDGTYNMVSSIDRRLLNEINAWISRYS